MEEVEGFLYPIQPMKIIPSLEDKLILKENKAGSFSVKLMYSLLKRCSSVPFPVQLIWNPIVPQKVGFFFFCLGDFLG